MPEVIALHGDYANSARMLKDMGDPPWVTEYFDAGGWRDYQESLDVLKHMIYAYHKVILVGYSRGGQAICDLSRGYSEHILAAVLYESPVSGDCGGDFPVLMIWNNKGALKRRTNQAVLSMEEWTQDRKVELLIGKGRHVQRDEDRELSHAWDTDLNDRIGDWISRL